MVVVWFNTAFIGENNMIVLEKTIVDKANKDKKKKFNAEIFSLDAFRSKKED